MKIFSLRKKLIMQFDRIIQNDDKLVALEGALDALDSNEGISQIPLEHYKEIDKIREKHLKGASQSKTWEEVKIVIKSKNEL